MTFKFKLNENLHGARASALKLYKNRGETPLECLDRFKNDNLEYKEEKMTYAGRLDPLAEGLLLVLVGEECKNKEKYLGMDKEYEVDVLFGFATDTYDILGIPRTNAERKNGGLTLRSEAGKGESSVFLNSTNIQNILESFVGKFSQKYPAFSSKTIKGILNARKNGGLTLRIKKGESSFFSETEEEIPSKEVEIKSIKLLSERTISKNDLEKYIKDSVALVKGDFRQEEILSEWQKAWSRVNLDEFQVISIKVSCTSGTYMRSLANSIGEKVGIPVLALNIRRIKVGEYVL